MRQVEINRKLAQERKEQFYQGRLCRACGNTKRKVVNRACTVCQKRQLLEYRKRNRARLSADSCRWARENREKYREYQRDYRRRSRGLPKPTRPEPKLCECCGGPPCGVGKSLHLDHCHATGKFRGWVCYKCNSALGLLGDTVDGVAKALEYLVRAL